jgi:hypothetical protein
VLGDDEQVRLVANAPAGTCQIQAYKLGNNQLVRDAESVGQLERAVADAVRACGHEWPPRLLTGRLFAGMPATNYRTISQLIGASTVEAVFDPYLDNSSLTDIIAILSFGSGGVSNGVRLLGSTKKTQGPVPRFTKAGVDAWLTQQGVSGEARVFTASQDDHRRFMLLSGGQCLILGPSFNAIHKNEATHVEADTVDRSFFDAIWTTASPLR